MSELSPAIAIVASALLAASCASPTAPTAATPGAPGVAGTAFTDFSFARGAPVAGMRLTACGRVTLTTTNSTRAGTGAFRMEKSAEPTAVTLEFDRPVATFELTVSGLRTGTMLGDFNIGSPPRLSGDLIQTADGRVTSGTAPTAGGAAPTATAGAGTLSWPTLDTRTINLVARSAQSAAVSFDGFRAACRTLTEPPAT